MQRFREWQKCLRRENLTKMYELWHLPRKRNAKTYFKIRL